MNDGERRAAERHLAEIESLTEGSDTAAEENEKLTLLAKMFLAKPSAAMTDMGAAARAESYMLALYDIPAWSIGEAIKKWHRGDVAGFTQDDLKWVPDTSALRKVAAGILEPYRKNAATIRRVLAAKNSLDEAMVSQ